MNKHWGLLLLIRSMFLYCNTIRNYIINSRYLLYQTAEPNNANTQKIYEMAWPL